LDLQTILAGPGSLGKKTHGHREPHGFEGMKKEYKTMRGMKWLVVLGFGILLSSSGCCGFLQNGGCGRSCGCNTCETCGNDCGPVHRPYRERVVAEDGCGCNSCGARTACPSCGSCGECSDDCCQRNFCFHPLRAIGRLFTVSTWCGQGCGNSCETCNQCGAKAHRSGCTNCGHGGNEGGEMMEGEMQGDPNMVPTPATPTPANPSTKATRRPTDYNTYQR
jgi:hypothetical protein